MFTMSLVPPNCHIVLFWTNVSIGFNNLLMMSICSILGTELYLSKITFNTTCKSFTEDKLVT